jgi:hypothetical protein
MTRSLTDSALECSKSYLPKLANLDRPIADVGRSDGLRALPAEQLPTQD